MKPPSKLPISQAFHIPSLANVDNVNTVGTGLPKVVLHVHLEVLGTEVALSSQEHLDVLAGGVEDGGKVGGSHLDGFACLPDGGLRAWGGQSGSS